MGCQMRRMDRSYRAEREVLCWRRRMSQDIEESAFANVRHTWNESEILEFYLKKNSLLELNFAPTIPTRKLVPTRPIRGFFSGSSALFFGAIAASTKKDKRCAGQYWTSKPQK